MCLHPQNSGVHQEQAYACQERAYGRLCASHGAGTRRTPPPPSPTATQSASRVGDMSMHAQSMPNEMWERVHTCDHH